MVNNIAYFPSQCARNAAPVMSALLVALRRAGIHPVANDLDCDAALIWSVLWSGRMAANRSVYEHYKRSNRPVIVIDVGALHRGRTWKVAIDNVNALGYYGHQHDLDMDRPNKLGVRLVDPISRADHILIAAQHRNSLQWTGQQTPETWVQQKVQELRSHTDRPIVIRSHPRSPLKNLPVLPGTEIETPRQQPHTYDDFDIDYACHAVINHCSGPGIQAAICQTPVVVDRSSLAWPVSISMKNVNDPPTQDRQRWFIEICHTEYTLEEL